MQWRKNLVLMALEILMFARRLERNPWHHCKPSCDCSVSVCWILTPSPSLVPWQLGLLHVTQNGTWVVTFTNTTTAMLIFMLPYNQKWLWYQNITNGNCFCLDCVCAQCTFLKRKEYLCFFNVLLQCFFQISCTIWADQLVSRIAQKEKKLRGLTSTITMVCHES